MRYLIPLIVLLCAVLIGCTSTPTDQQTAFNVALQRIAVLEIQTAIDKEADPVKRATLQRRLIEAQILLDAATAGKVIVPSTQPVK